jgi:hypothetical protein
MVIAVQKDAILCPRKRTEGSLKCQLKPTASCLYPRDEKTTQKLAIDPWTWSQTGTGLPCRDRMASGRPLTVAAPVEPKMVKKKVVIEV